MAERDAQRPARSGLLARLAAQPVDGPVRTLLLAFAVCLVCSLVVTGSTVLLRPLQEARRAAERHATILAVLADIPGLVQQLGPIDARRLDVELIALDSGLPVPGADTEDYDQEAAAADPERSRPLPRAQDPAGLGRREDAGLVYLLRREGAVALIVLPVRGQGFQSMLRGYLALSGDGATIRGLVFHEQGETPGVGSQITEPTWLEKWRGRQVRDASGQIAVRVADGPADPGSPSEVDGITGATWTCEGVTNLLRFWLGDQGYGPFLERRAGS